MNRFSQYLFLSLGLALLGLTGCSTPQSRIEANPALYKSFSPEAQKQIADGDIDLSFSKEMVRMAWGSPSRVLRERSQEGDAEVWVYTRTRSRQVQGIGPTPVRTRDGEIAYVYPRPVQVREEQERARVIFRNREVSAIQEVDGVR